jgi:hypothetical protein
MIVMREEQFAARNIQRHNQSRVAVEQAAQQQRARSAPVSRRVDTQQPMYGSSRAGHSGSGALDGWSVLMLLALVVVIRRMRRTV